MPTAPKSQRRPEVSSDEWVGELARAHAIVCRLLESEKELDGLAMWVALAQAEADLRFALNARRSSPTE